MRLLIQHRSLYRYGGPAALGPHTVRLRPATHARAVIENYSLTISPEHQLRWQQDPYGNHVARVTFRSGTRVPALDVLVELAVDVRPVNPFDFFLDDRCEAVPFSYPAELAADLSPFVEPPVRSPGFDAFLAELPAGGKTVPFVVELNQLVNRRIAYVIREETGVWSPEETLAAGRGSCRDSAALLVAVLRARGLAARFASGYLVQLTDEGMIPDQPRGVGRDVVDLHAWAEVYLPGAGWIGLDATSGLLTGEGHIPLCCTAQPAAASPIEGTSDTPAVEVRFEMRLGRIGHEPRPTAPYTDEVWQALLAAGDKVDAALGDLALTAGGEPTFNSREHAEAPEWNSEALGDTKWAQGLRLAAELRARLIPGGALLRRQGKWYPGESLPRWLLEVVGRRGGARLWRDDAFPEATADATRLARTLATRLELKSSIIAAFEDPWRHLQEEAKLPVDVDPLSADLDDPEERRRLARVLDRGMGREAGWVLPLARTPAGSWRSEDWRFRRERLYLIPGDSPIGLRLPLASLPPVPPEPEKELEEPPDPRQVKVVVAPPVPGALRPIRTALCVEERNGQLYVFLPPLDEPADWFALVELVDAVRCELETDVVLEGYGPPASPEVMRIAVAPDPGVLEVNLPPTASAREHADLMDQVFDAALHAGLHSEKYLVDGRQAGSGGGHHLTFGGPTLAESPFVLRPDLLASLITFCQHHPAMSFLFTGLFVGPTSQAPRVDEARHDALYELEIALRRAFERRGDEPPWLSDMLFRHLLVDVTGNTHRAEISIDKLHDWRTEHGRQGLIELRAFEMPPHPRMAAAQMMLVRALIAAFAAAPYDQPLVRWGQALGDRFLLPHWLWSDFEDVLGYLAGRGLELPRDAYRPFLELRCPVVGRMQAGDVALEVRNALEPWHVLGEEPSGGGTSRFVDSSMERVEVRVDGLVQERHQVLVNFLELPMRPTGTAGEAVGGVRFRAWAPAHSLHAHIGIHHPLRFDVVDRWARRSLGACAYHVWHPEGRAFLSPPLTRFEASARRAQRFTLEGPSPWPVEVRPAAPHPDAPCTLDLRRFPGDRPMPDPDDPDSDPDPDPHPAS